MAKSIYVGINEICDLTLQLSKGFRELGFEVTNVVMDQSDRNHLPYGREGYRPHDRYLDPQSGDLTNNYTYVLMKELLRQAPKHDIFLFSAGRSFYSNLVWNRVTRPLAYADLPLLDLIGKKTGVIVTGSELRSYDLLFDELEEAGLNSHLHYLKEFVEEHGHNESINKTRAKKIQKHADAVFGRQVSTQYLGDYSLFTVPVDPEEFDYSNNDRDVPLIVHAPTNTGLKGTKYVNTAIEKLREEGYEFDFEIVQDMPNQEFRKKLTESDIVVDQLLLPAHGLLAVEAMATGNAVLGSVVPEFNEKSEDIPVMTTTPDTLYENLRYLLENPEERYEMAERGRPYITEHHHYKTVATDILDSLDVDY